MAYVTRKLPYSLNSDQGGRNARQRRRAVPPHLPVTAGEGRRHHRTEVGQFRFEIPSRWQKHFDRGDVRNFGQPRDQRVGERELGCARVVVDTEQKVAAVRHGGEVFVDLVFEQRGIGNGREEQGRQGKLQNCHGG